MEEKYGIELELLTDAFNKKVNQIKKQGEGIKKAFDPNDISGLKINYGNEGKNSSGFIEKYHKQVLEETKGMNQIKYDSDYIQQYINGLSTLKNKAKEVKQSVQEVKPDEISLNAWDRLKQKMQGIKLLVNKFKKPLEINTGKAEIGINRLMSKMKRFAFSLFSIRSIYSLLSRASSAYMSQDTALANKLQAVWIGLGAMLEPIISGIVNVMLKAVKYINIFIKALTGVDLLAKATAKSMGKTTKGAKALSKALAGFDELNNLDTNSDGGSSGIDTSWADAFNKLKIDTKWADRIKNFGKWMKSNWSIVLSSLAGVVTLFKILNPLVEIFGFKLGLIKALGISITIFGVTYAIQGLIKYLKDPSFKKFGEMIQGIGLTVFGLGVAFLSVPVAIAGAVVLAVGTIIKFWDDIKAFFQSGINWLISKSDFIHSKFGNTIGNIYDELIKCLQAVLNRFDLFFVSIKGVFDGIIKIVKGVFTGNWNLAWQGVGQIFSNVWNFIYNSFSTFGDFIWRKVIQPAINNFRYLKDNVINLFRNIGTKVGEVIGNAFKNVINSVLRAIENILNAPIRAINNLINVINAVPGINIGKLNTFRLPRLNVGTNYVPQDQLAYIHKGEAVIPKKFNSQEYFGNGNEKTNSLLETLIEKVDNIEINPYTTIKDVGQASLQFKRDRQRQTGVNVFA